MLPEASTVAQKSAVGQETEISQSPTSMLAGDDHELPS
jgi:hypothetical protein